MFQLCDAVEKAKVQRQLKDLWFTRGDFQANEIILHHTVMADTFHYTFVQTHRMYNPATEPQWKLWILDDNNVSAKIHEL